MTLSVDPLFVNTELDTLDTEIIVRAVKFELEAVDLTP